MVGGRGSIRMGTPTHYACKYHFSHIIKCNVMKSTEVQTLSANHVNVYVNIVIVQYS